MFLYCHLSHTGTETVTRHACDVKLSFRLGKPSGEVVLGGDDAMYRAFFRVAFRSAKGDIYFRLDAEFKTLAPAGRASRGAVDALRPD